MAENNSKTESFEKTLFKAADKLRKNIDVAEYKHIALGLNNFQIQTLSGLRDLLLPKLMKREIRVKGI
jgi:type I restriction enzyme M protein